MPSKKTTYFLVFIGFFLAIVLIFSSSKKQQKPLTREDFAPESYVLVEESLDSTVENFPDIPQYPVSEIVTSKFYMEEGGEGYSLELSTNDSVLDVIEWYKNVLTDKEWNLIFESEETKIPTYFLIEYKKPDIQLDVMAVTQQDGSTRVIITHHYNMGEYGPAVKYE